MSFNCAKSRDTTTLFCMMPLNSEQLEFLPCNVKGVIAGKPAEMVVDSGCTRTLVHKKYASKRRFPNWREIKVLTAAGKRLVIPLAWVELKSEQGRRNELVGVLDKLPFDCLLGRSSFGQTLSKKHDLEQWEKNK